jgi:dephospho-CoA kinase
MKIIGLTGSIGSGKSTVARFLAELGATVIDADRIGHTLLKPGTEVYRKVIASFGQGILAADGSVDRARLGEIVFHDEKARKRLNRITHPAIKREVIGLLKRYNREGKKAVVLEVPLLLEAGWAPLVDEVWVTAASGATALRRLKERGGLSERDALARIRTQLSLEERAGKADLIIDTECSLDELKAKVRELWRKRGAI